MMAAWREMPTAWACSAHGSIRATQTSSASSSLPSWKTSDSAPSGLAGAGSPRATCACTRRRCARREATIVPAIIRVWSEPAETVAQGYHRIHSQFGDRFLLGIGVGHPETQSRDERPCAKLTDYLNRLDDA